MNEVPWGQDKPCFVVAELGINHNGSVEIAKQLIDAAVAAGANAVKFQKRTVEVVYTPEELARPRENPFGKTNGDLKRGLEFSFEDYCEISDHCDVKEIQWFASPWDVESVAFLKGFGVPFYKVASACITDKALLSAITTTEKPVIISTGMSDEYQISDAVDFFGDTPMAILACTSTYPAAIVELNLARIYKLQQMFPRDTIGYSGHEVGIWSTLCAVAMGAKVVERHLTLDRAMWGSDQAASLEPPAFAKLITEIRDFEKAYGTEVLECLESERPILEKLRRVK